MEREVLWKSLMMNGSIIMFWRQSILEQYIENISKEGFHIYLFDCESLDKNTSLLELGKTLDFPDYYGKNLDAFNDCLSDIMAFLHSSNPQLHIQSVGAMPVLWNNEEWLNKFEQRPYRRGYGYERHRKIHDLFNG